MLYLLGFFAVKLMLFSQLHYLLAQLNATCKSAFLAIVFFLFKQIAATTALAIMLLIYLHLL